jgi:hypothetical protein
LTSRPGHWAGVVGGVEVGVVGGGEIGVVGGGVVVGGADVDGGTDVLGGGALDVAEGRVLGLVGGALDVVAGADVCAAVVAGGGACPEPVAVSGADDARGATVGLGRWVGALVDDTACPGPWSGRPGLCPVKLTMAAMPISAAATARAAAATTRNRRWCSGGWS